MNFDLITNDEELAECCEFFNTCEQLAIDTEFKRETTYYPKPCLVQIAGNQRTVLVDPFNIQNFAPLKALFLNESITKILHAGRQDMEVFQLMLSCLPTPVFDTQIAASLLGMPNQVGYSSLVKAFFEIELDKTLTRTDWEKRPLKQDELNYAANDVEYLETIYQKQKEELEKLGRFTWLTEDVNQQLHENLDDDALEKVWKKISRNPKLDQSQRNILFSLNQWREKEAINRDRARQFILSNDVLIGLAFKQPSTLTELKNVDRIPKPAIHRYSEKLLEIINSEETQLLNIPEDTQNRLSPEESDLFKKLKSKVQEVAKELKIEDTLICNRKTLESLARGNTDNKLLQGWRYEVVGQQLEPLLS